MKSLSIAILPHLSRSITRYTRASRSRVIYDLIHELTLKGHKVTLIGTEDSRTDAKNLAVAPMGVRKMGVTENEFYRHVSYLVQAIKMLESHQDKFDLVHSHMYPEFLPLLLGPQLKIPLVTTVHTEFTPYLIDALKQFPQAHLIALTDHHKRDGKGLHIEYVVHNGINMQTFPLSEKPGNYLLFVGRIKVVRLENGDVYDPKGILTAIAVAKKTKKKLLISGSIETRAMYEEFIRPHLSDQIKLVGGVSAEAPLSQEEVAALYQRAEALLFPIHWEEPFGLVVVEANACGTPVIAFNRGAVPELIKNGVNGYIANSFEQMLEAVWDIGKIDRKNCRTHVEDAYSRERMGENYEKVYFDVLKRT